MWYYMLLWNILFYLIDVSQNIIIFFVQVVIVGNGAVGKSSMIQRYCRGIFTRNYKKTIGVDFLEKQLRYHIVKQLTTTQAILLAYKLNTQPYHYYPMFFPGICIMI